MTYLEALDIVVPRTGVERYRWLCSDDNPEVEKRDEYRGLVLRMAGEPKPYPSLIAQAGSAIGAAAGFVASGFAIATEEEQAERLAICYSCEHYDWIAGRCRVCGCFATFKARLATEHCPLPEPKW